MKSPSLCLCKPNEKLYLLIRLEKKNQILLFTLLRKKKDLKFPKEQKNSFQ